MAQMIVDTGMDHGSDALYRPAQMLYAFTGTGMAQIPHGFMAQMLYAFTGMVMAQIPHGFMAQMLYAFTGMDHGSDTAYLHGHGHGSDAI